LFCTHGIHHHDINFLDYIPDCMKALIAPDKFKGSLSAAEVCEAVSDALLEIDSSNQVIKIPLADGGEGTFEILVHQSKGSIKRVTVLDPLLRPIEAGYGVSQDGKTAFIEMAKASGLQLLKESERNPLFTSSIGTGQLIVDAIHEGATNIILGIGGSATNDACIGLAHALGYRFFNRDRVELPPIGKSLSEIEWIDDSQVDKRLHEIAFTVLCDVDNPLYGMHGAAHVYAPQKGATEIIVNELDLGLRHFADLAKSQYHADLNFPGAGAAGGVGAGAKLFLNASFKKGIDYISELTSLTKHIKICDIVITGEGKVDAQTLSGKVVAHVLSLAHRYNKPVFILCGQCTLSDHERKQLGAHSMIALATQPSEVRLALTQPIPLIKSKIKEAILNFA